MSRRKKKDTDGKQHIPEPSRRSIYDVLLTNLKTANRNAYIHRLIYSGEHKYTDPARIAEVMENSHKVTNEAHCLEPLSGILLYYSTYFCCIVEGSEEAIHKHITLLFDTTEEHDLDNVKILSAIHHIKTRFWDEWMAYNGKPPQRVELIDDASDLEDSMRYVTECCEKLYKFANAFISDQFLQRKLHEQEEGEDEGEEHPALAPRKTRSLVVKDPYSMFIPEIKLLKFLVNCRYLKTLKQFHRYYEYIGTSPDFAFKCWPAPKSFITYDIFDEKYDPISNLPQLEGEEAEEPTKLEDESMDAGSTDTNVSASAAPAPAPET